MKGKHRTHLNSTYLDSLLSSFFFFSFHFNWFFTVNINPHWNGPDKLIFKGSRKTRPAHRSWDLRVGLEDKWTSDPATAALVPEFGTWTPLWTYLSGLLIILLPYVFGNGFKSSPRREVTQWALCGTPGRGLHKQGRTSNRLQTQDLVSLTWMQTKHKCN